ncbi:hypothetical protein H6P81_002924 [Aristolochia fimbriata]|uniref:Protein FAR1-RELATED SEQUENCE n=1 Tax=Aristolochia fimbriata TaxID=158543 RepID=A0AAV7FEZ7_ARIFI|nr:hypothetical protein H6P81_002924 [Aristolochia fimbriata]
MAKAIAIVLPESPHRLCTWHIFQNATKHLGSVFHRFPQFKLDFSRCIYEFEIEIDFLEAWEKMLDEYNLRGNSWLEDLFKEKYKWAMVYGRHTFCANLRSTQRSETFNSLMRKYLNSRLHPMHFFEQFDRLIEDRRHEELQADFRSINSTPTLFVPCPILKQASAHYTMDIFFLFQEEWQMFHAIEIHHVMDEGDQSEFKAIDHIKKGEKTIYLNNVNQQRWSKEAKSGDVVDNHGFVIQENPHISTTQRYMDLCHNFIKIASRVEGHETTYLIARDMQGYYHR